jgi:hypothetical protein
MSSYTGPTSGRITIGGDGSVTRESFDDPMLSREEEQAVAWFTALSPNARLREVRRLKWNADERLRELETLKAASRRDDTEITRLRGQLAARRPDGFELPKSAADLLAHAEAHGWKTARAWIVRTEDEGGGAGLRIIVGQGPWQFKLSWSCDPGGAGRMVRSGLARGPRRDWHDAPPLVRIKQIITENPAPADETN